MADLRVTRQVAEIVASDPPDARLLRTTRQVAEVVASEPSPERVLRVTRQAVEVMGVDPSVERRLRVTRQAVEVMASDPPLDGTAVGAETTLVITQAASCNHVAGRSASNTLSLADSAAVNFSVGCSASNTLNLSDAAGINAVYFFDASNSLLLAGQATGEAVTPAHSVLAFSQQAIAVVTRPVFANCVLVLNHAVGVVGSFVVSAGNTLGFGLQATSATVVFGEASNSLSFAQQATGNPSRAVSASNALAFSGSASGVATSTIECSASNTLPLANQASITVVHAIGASSVLSLDTQAESSLSKAVSASNTLVLSGSADAVGVSLIEVSAASELWLSDQADGYNSTKHVAGQNGLALDVNAHGNKVTHVDATTPIYFTETTLDRLTFDKIEVEHGIFASASDYVYVDPEPTGNILSFFQRAGVVHVRADGISATATSALALSQWTNPTPTGNGSSQLTLGHSASATVGRVATNALTLDQQASRTIERFVSASSTLTLHQAVNVVLAEGCVTRAYTPFVGSTDDPNAPAPPSPNVPILERVEGVQLYWPVDVPAMNVTLRGPELDNKDRLRFQRINRETRGGTLVVFADPIWPKVQQLTLEFVGLEEDEAQSLLSFIAATLGKKIGMRDWENRHWTGVIVSPDEPIIRNGRHNISTALEFEGVPA